jgi:hypothetical protein
LKKCFARFVFDGMAHPLVALSQKQLCTQKAPSSGLIAAEGDRGVGGFGSETRTRWIVI